MRSQDPGGVVEWERMKWSFVVLLTVDGEGIRKFELTRKSENAASSLYSSSFFHSHILILKSLNNCIFQ